MPNYNVGDNFYTIADGVASKPRWLKWIPGGTNQLLGHAELPSGHRRLVILNGSDQRSKSDMYVVPLSQSSTSASWRMVIYAPNGSYITSTGTGDIPTIGTPQVRIGVNAPSKAVIKFPVMKNNPMNVLSSTFAKWSDGHTGAVERGMEVTVEYRDKKSGSMTMVFRGMIYQIESGDVITVTAYDRLMDMVQYSDQYQSHAGYTQNDTSRSRATSGTNYVYTMNNNVGTLIAAASEDILSIDATAALGHASSAHSFARFIAHPLPVWDGRSPEQGRNITKVTASVYSFLAAKHTLVYDTLTLNAKARVVLYKKSGGSLIQVVATSYQSWTCSVSASGDIAVSNTATQSLTWTVDWEIQDAPADYYLGLEVVNEGTTASLPGVWSNITTNAYGNYTSSKITFAGDFYTSTDGSSWTAVASGDHPEIAVTFEHSGQSISTSSFTVSGNTLTIAQSLIPEPSVSGYLICDEKGNKITVSYFVSGAAGLREIIADLIEWAGLVPDVVNENMGQTTYYNITTYDYMTCAQEILKGGNYGIFASITEPGKAHVRPRHTISETPVTTFSTDPADYGTYEMEIVSHNLTAHWMAEKATQAYIAEDATASGLPVALETDDALMDNSLVEIMQSPLRSAIADNSLGTHSLMANAASGKMVQLHTNVFEGSMVLAGYRLDIWDLSSGYAGGNPIGIRVPEYGAQGTAVPTEIIIGDGVTQVSLNNIRTADRSEVANSMGLSADAISNNASAIPKSVYLFPRIDSNDVLYKAGMGLINFVKLYDEDGAVATQSSGSYLKTVMDSVGYCHILAIFPASAQPSGYAPNKPINRVSAKWTGSGGTEVFAVLDNPKYAYDGQTVHVDIRFKPYS